MQPLLNSLSIAMASLRHSSNLIINVFVFYKTCHRNEPVFLSLIAVAPQRTVAQPGFQDTGALRPKILTCKKCRRLKLLLKLCCLMHFPQSITPYPAPATHRFRSNFTTCPGLNRDRGPGPRPLWVRQCIPIRRNRVAVCASVSVTLISKIHGPLNTFSL